MKNTMPLKSSTNSPSPNRAEAASSPPDAPASSSHPTPVPSIPASMVGPKPRRRLRRPMAAVALSEPMPASIHSAPTRPALKPSSRAAYSTTIASDACRKICQTEIAQASARSTALRQIADNPSRISAPMLEARIFGASLGPERMPRRIQAETRNDSASSSIANGAVSHWISAPAEERERQRLERGEDAHLERRRIEQQGAGERQRQEGDLPAEMGDGERAPQPHKIAVAPQPV